MVKFIDEAKIYVRSGDGGNGCVSFRREKYVPRGGPDGGDGGNGGEVIIVARGNMSSLLDYRYKQHYKAKRGEHGRGKNQHGKNSPELLIPVPVGTLVKNMGSGEVIGDLTEEGQTLVVAPGGRGGKGNARFATSTNRAPKHAQPGEEGEEKTILLELKLLADVGIVGLPNAGKSTLISRISAARPKIADYPFTTTVPNLGVVSYGEGKSFVVADIPGLIKGAHEGSGLGVTFLKHIERTRLLIHLVDISQFSGRDPVEDYNSINHELSYYGHGLESKPQIVAGNKIDMEEGKDNLDEIETRFSELGIEIIPVSALTGNGIDTLVVETGRILEQSTAARSA
ncbi:MAG: GTPase ObgE [Candidatus Dadabacteria bacterium]|nr:GTPase ObgE [Candidatus Dadabacteria bacterium]